MLTQNFKSAADLGLTDQEHSALITTLGMMERGEIKFFDVSKCEDIGHGTEFTGLFNLGEWAEKYTCGTVACIGGTAELVGKLPRNSINDKCDILSDLDDLCYPAFTGAIYNSTTVEQAAKALRSYLTTGKANWAEALA